MRERANTVGIKGLYTQLLKAAAINNRKIWSLPLGLGNMPRENMVPLKDLQPFQEPIHAPRVGTSEKNARVREMMGKIYVPL